MERIEQSTNRAESMGESLWLSDSIYDSLQLASSALDTAELAKDVLSRQVGGLNERAIDLIGRGVQLSADQMYIQNETEAGQSFKPDLGNDFFSVYRVVGRFDGFMLLDTKLVEQTSVVHEHNNSKTHQTRLRICMIVSAIEGTKRAGQPTILVPIGNIEGPIFDFTINQTADNESN